MNKFDKATRAKGRSLLRKYKHSNILLGGIYDIPNYDRDRAEHVYALSRVHWEQLLRLIGAPFFTRLSLLKTACQEYGRLHSQKPQSAPAIAMKRKIEQDCRELIEDAGLSIRDNS